MPNIDAGRGGGALPREDGVCRILVRAVGRSGLPVGFSHTAAAVCKCFILLGSQQLGLVAGCMYALFMHSVRVANPWKAWGAPRRLWCC